MHSFTKSHEYPLKSDDLSQIECVTRVITIMSLINENASLMRGSETLEVGILGSMDLSLFQECPKLLKEPQHRQQIIQCWPSEMPQ